MIRKIICGTIGWVSLFNGTLTLLGHLMPKPFSWKIFLAATPEESPTKSRIITRRYIYSQMIVAGWLKSYDWVILIITYMTNIKINFKSEKQPVKKRIAPNQNGIASFWKQNDIIILSSTWHSVRYKAFGTEQKSLWDCYSTVDCCRQSNSYKMNTHGKRFNFYSIWKYFLWGV